MTCMADAALCGNDRDVELDRVTRLLCSAVRALRCLPIPSGEFDAIIAWDVEHKALDAARAAQQRQQSAAVPA